MVEWKKCVKMLFYSDNEQADADEPNEEKPTLSEITIEIPIKKLQTKKSQGDGKLDTSYFYSHFQNLITHRLQ